MYRHFTPVPLKSIGLLDSDGRLQLWQIAWHSIQTHPWFGVGPGHFAVVAYPTETLHAHPHNAWIKMACEWGIPAALLMSLVWLWAAIAWFRKLPHFIQQQNFLAIALTASLIGASLHALTYPRDIVTGKQIGRAHV